MALKPVVHIRFGRIWSFQLGQFAIPIELYLCERDEGKLPKRTFDVFYHYDNEDFNRSLKNPVKPVDAVCNLFLDKKFKPFLRIWEGARRLDQLNRFLTPGSNQFIIPGHEPVDFDGFLDRSPAHITFTDEEEHLGRKNLINMGIDPDAPFYCFHSRDGMYLKISRPRIASIYGEWTDLSYRISSIKRYIDCADELTKLGYYAIRMGKQVAESLDTDNPKIIDYATKYHSDFMDVYLSAKCKFFLGTNSGMTALPLIFRKPHVFVNVFPLAEVSYCAGEHNFFIPRHVFSNTKGRNLTFRETMELGLGSEYPKHPRGLEALSKYGIDILENSSEQITSVTLESQSFLTTGMKYTKHDEALQAQVMDLIMEYKEPLRIKQGRPFSIRVGQQFLRDNEDWLN